MANAFVFRVSGPPANYTIPGSTDAVSWIALATVTNQLIRKVSLFDPLEPSPAISFIGKPTITLEGMS